MNTLSIFLYFADVSQGLRIVFIGACVATIGLLALRNIYAANCNDNASDYRGKFYEGYVPKTYSFIPYLPFILVFALLAAFTPSKTTFYAIAASEIGEKIITSEPVSGVLTDTLKLVQQKLKDALKDEQPVEKK